MTATPPLLKTYEEARLLWGAKGWVLTKVSDDLSEKSELKRFNLSHPMLSRKTKPGSNCPLEPEVAAAIENLKTWPGYERQAEIATKGLLALRGDPSTKEVDQLEKEIREHLPGEIARTLIDALEEKAGARESKLLQEVGRLGRRHLTISAGVGALVAVLLVPFLFAFARPSHVIYPPAGRPDASPRWFEPGSALAMFEWGEKPPVDQTVPDWTLPGQKVAPCDEGLGEVAINGNCWAWMGAVKPPCGRLFRQGDLCYRPIAADPKKPVEPGPDR